MGVAFVAFVGVMAVWGHFWEFRFGNPSSESCASCHILDSYFDSQNDPIMLASRHAQQGLTCVDCHPRTLEDQIHETLAYLQDDYRFPFRRAQYPMTTCFECHSHSSYDQIAWRTTDLGITDPQAMGYYANPHQPPHYSNLECHTCHRVHRESVLMCSECHMFEFRIPVVASP